MNYGSVTPQPNSHFMEGRELGHGNVDLSKMPYSTEVPNPSYHLYPAQSYPPPQIIDVIEYPQQVPIINNDNTPLLIINKTPRFIPILPPNILGTLLFGLVLLSSWVGYNYFQHYVFENATIIMSVYPLTLLTVVHLVALLMLLPGVGYSCVTKDLRTYVLPWAVIAEVFFVSYFCLLWFVMHRSCVQNLCEVTFCLHTLLIVIITIPWVEERIDIGGIVAAVAVTATSALLLTNSELGWDWSIYRSNWPTLLASFGMAFIFAFYVVVTRKSTSHPTTGYFQVLFVHVTLGLIFSMGAALGLEVFNDLSMWTSFFKDNWSLDYLWKSVCLIFIGLFYKIALVLTSRFSEVHTTGFAIQLGVLLGLSVNTLQEFLSSSSLLNWITNNPKITAGYFLLCISCLYWLVRVLMLKYMYKRRSKNSDEDDTGVLLETYSSRGYYNQ